jgi:hypothetical protein
LRRIGAFDDPNSLVGSLIAAAREAAAAHEAELTARFQQQVNGTTPQRDDDNLYA